MFNDLILEALKNIPSGMHNFLGTTGLIFLGVCVVLGGILSIFNATKR